MAPRKPQPPPTTQPQPAPADTPTGRIVALPAGELLPATAAELGAPAVPVAGAALAAATAKALAAILAAFEVFEMKRKVEAKDRLTQTLTLLYPERTPDEIDSLVREEMKRDREFQARQMERLRRDLPGALAVTEPSKRAEAVQKILERERRYVQMREQAMADRAAARANHLTIKEQSPSGAYWKLSDHVTTHTPLCLALANQFWPWSVLTIVHPQLHPGCACYLLSKQQAVADGLMSDSQAPDVGTPEYGLWEKDALRRVEGIGKKLGGLTEAGVTQAEIDDHLELIFAEGAITHHVGARYALRYPKGVVKGGEFMPKHGGDSGGRSLSRRLLRDLLPHKLVTPAQKARDHVGEWKTIDGRQVFVPEHRAFERKIGDKVYYSPPGSTNVYEQKEFLRAKPTIAPERGAAVTDTMAKLREQHREDAAAVARRAVAAPQAPDRLPVEVGAPSKATHSGVIDAGFLSHRNEIDTGSGGVTFHYTHPFSGAQASVTYSDGRVKNATWHPGTAPLQRAPLVTGRLPESFDEFITDVFSQMNEVGRSTGHDVQIGRFVSDPHLKDHSGFHHWDGVIVLGRDVRPSIERAAQARAEGRDLTHQESRDLYAAIQTAVHEGLHGINPISPREFAKPASRAMEEALTEELAHEVTLKMLRRYKADDVLRWVKANPNDHKVEGSYLLYRQALGGLLKEGDVPPEKNGEVLSALKYSFEPTQRISGVAALMTHAGEDGAHEQAVADATRVLTQAGHEGESGDEHLPGFRPLIQPDLSGAATVEKPLLVGGEVQVRQPDGTTLPATVLDSYPAGIDGSHADTRFVATVKYKDGSVERYVTPAMLASPGDRITDEEHRARVQRSLTPAQRTDVPKLVAKGATEPQAEMLALKGRKAFKVQSDGVVTFTQQGRSYRMDTNGRLSFTPGLSSPGGERPSAEQRAARRLARGRGSGLWNGSGEGAGLDFDPRALSRGDQPIPPGSSAKDVTYEAAKKQGFVTGTVVGRLHGQPVGVMTVTDAGGLHPQYVEGVIVHPELRRQGVASEMLRLAREKFGPVEHSDALSDSGGAEFAAGMPSPGGERGIHPRAIWNDDSTLAEVVTPSGRTFDASIVMPSEEERHRIGSVFDSIAEVHEVKDFTPSPIPVLMFPDPHDSDASAGYASQHDDSGRVVPIMFRITPGSDLLELSLAHEVAHYIDQQFFGHGEGWGSADTPPGHPLADVMQALDATTTIQHIKSLVGENSMIHARVIHPDGREEVREFSLDEFQDRFRYLLSPHEQFARAYSQWIGVRSGNAVMIAQSAVARGGPRDLAPGQWAADEFEPVSHALDAAFEAVGWRQA